MARNRSVERRVAITRPILVVAPRVQAIFRGLFRPWGKIVRFPKCCPQFAPVAVRRFRKNPARAVLLFADTERSADQLYFTGFGVPDPFIAMQIGRRKIGVLNALEFGRAIKESALDDVLPLEEWNECAKKRLRVDRPGPGGIIATLARHFGVRAFRVPDDFPVGVARQMLAHGVRTEPSDGPLFREREIKTAA